MEKVIFFIWLWHSPEVDMATKQRSGEDDQEMWVKAPDKNYIHRLYFNVTEVPVAWVICFSFHSQIYTYMCDLFFQSFQLHLLVFISDRSVQADVKTI